MPSDKALNRTTPNCFDNSYCIFIRHSNCVDILMRWAEEQRMNWIANRHDPFNRQDLMDQFKISVPQASKDIQKFISLYPDVWSYNFKKKQYERNNSMTQPKSETVDLDALKREVIEHVREWWGEEPTLSKTHAASIEDTRCFYCDGKNHLCLGRDITGLEERYFVFCPNCSAQSQSYPTSRQAAEKYLDVLSRIVR